MKELLPNSFRKILEITLLECNHEKYGLALLHFRLRYPYVRFVLEQSCSYSNAIKLYLYDTRL